MQRSRYAVISGSLSPRHDASSGCGWRNGPSNMEGSCEYIEQAVADSRKGLVAQLGGWLRC